jgi:hypothetical protein
MLQSQIKAISIGGRRYSAPEFAVVDENHESALTKDFLRLEFSSAQFAEFKSTLQRTNPGDPKWDLKTQYILLAEEHFAFGDVRLAIIDMDIAVDICMRQYLAHKAGLSSAKFESLTAKLSTGDLLKAARLFGDHDHADDIRHFEQLHDVRNTILHKHQRTVRGATRKLFEHVRRSMRSFEAGTA